MPGPNTCPSHTHKSNDFAPVFSGRTAGTGTSSATKMRESRVSGRVQCLRSPTGPQRKCVMHTVPSRFKRRPVSIAPAYRYCVYGVRVLSDMRLNLPDHPDGQLAKVRVRLAPASYFQKLLQGVDFEPLSDSWYRFARLPDASSYARWEGVGEFAVSGDGRRITCRPDKRASMESFQVYLLGQALSFALVKSGFEPLHATTVVVGGEGIVFLGDSGLGKSTLAACFLDAGHRMLTDDLLLLHHTARRVVAYPGPPRIKLLPRIARKYMRDAAAGVRMNLDTEKLIVPLEHARRCATPVPVKAIYVIAPPLKNDRTPTIRIEPLTARDGFLKLVENTFNYRVIDPHRLSRQFAAASCLVDAMPVRRLSYPRVLRQLPEVRDAILRDLDSGTRAEVACAY